ncbi:MAG: helix-turn-helix domain-containing protein [Egibacteraceae bacterium]
MRAVDALAVTTEQRQTLEQWVRAHDTPQQVVLRCRIVLLAADGLSNTAIAERLQTTRTTVRLWRDRFAHHGPTALRRIKEGRGRKPSIPTEKVTLIVHDTLSATPPSASRWTCRTMAKRHGVSPATVQRIWAAYGIKPHQSPANPRKRVARDRATLQTAQRH